MCVCVCVSNLGGGGKLNFLVAEIVCILISLLLLHIYGNASLHRHVWCHNKLQTSADTFLHSPVGAERNEVGSKNGYDVV
jgi:hypothetical protein